MFTAFDTKDRSGIRIYSRPVIDKLEHIDLLCPNVFTF